MKVEVYGGNHSPWVQAVLLALHERGIEHRLRQVQPLESIKKWGVLMPAVSIDDEPWEIESSQILVKLGLDPISDEDLQAASGDASTREVSRCTRRSAEENALPHVDQPAPVAARDRTHAALRKGIRGPEPVIAAAVSAL